MIAAEMFKASRGQLPLVVNCAPAERAFISPHFADSLRWRFFTGGTSAGRLLHQAAWGRLFAAARAALFAKRAGAGLLISHDPRISFGCELFSRKLRFRGKHVAYAFNFSQLPEGRRRDLMSRVFPTIDRLVVFSMMERTLYHEWFGIPLERFDFIHWGVAPPAVETPRHPLEPGEYLCALGENARDYRTLFAAMEQLPGIRLVVVARPYNLEGLRIPSNVRVHANIPLARAMNLLLHSRFMVLPLAQSQVPCGHVTLVNAMHLAKAMVVTNSTGVQDYVKEGVNAIGCEARNVAAMKDAIARLYEDRLLCEKLGANGAAFAARHCTEMSIVDYFEKHFAQYGMITLSANTTPLRW